MSQPFKCNHDFTSEFWWGTAKSEIFLNLSWNWWALSSSYKYSLWNSQGKNTWAAPVHIITLWLSWMYVEKGWQEAVQDWGLIWNHSLKSPWWFKSVYCYCTCMTLITDFSTINMARFSTNICGTRLFKNRRLLSQHTPHALFHKTEKFKTWRLLYWRKLFSRAKQCAISPDGWIFVTKIFHKLTKLYWKLDASRYYSKL